MDLRTNFRPQSGDLFGISLCAGYAGLDLGLRIAEPNYRTVAFVERESHAAATLVARMADQALGEAPIWDDLRTFDGRPWCGRVHLVSAGYPCQPFSYAGRRGGKDDPRHLWPDVARIVEEAAPEWVFCENVEGHLSLGYAEVAADLRRMGYDPKAGLFTAREVGARHRRRRLFILAHSNSVRRRLYPGPGGGGGSGRHNVADGHQRGERRTILPGAVDARLDEALAGVARVGRLDGEPDDPIFAPGPGELQEWERLLLRRPDLQPAILRADDGLADRVDRTRGAGNGVSSLAAALAWAVLKTAHGIPG